MSSEQKSCFLNHCITKISTLPSEVPKEHHQWIIFANYIDLYAIANNLVVLIISVYLSMWLVVLCSFVGTVSFSISLLLKIMGGKSYRYCVFFVFTVVCGTCFFATLLAGWKSGFQYYILTPMLTAFYIPFSNKKWLFIISFLLFGTFIGTYFTSTLVVPRYMVPEFWEHILFLISMSCFAFSFVYIPYINNKASRAAIETLSITLAKNAELERLSRLKDDFLANTSHELRTPLHGIIGIAESLLHDRTVQSTSFLRNNLCHIITSAQRLTNLVNDILDISKISHNDLKINPQPLDITQMINAVLPNFTASAAKKGITITTDFPTGLPYVMADESRLIQIIFNLVGNAVKFTDQGNVTISSFPKDNQVALCVIDTGIGIAERDLCLIFNEFEQGTFHKDNFRGGTGIGLSITKKLVELHGGTITVASIPGTGSTFTVTLPVADKIVSKKNPPVSSFIHNAIIFEPDDTIQDVSSTVKISETSASHTILAIDDETINLQIIRNHLEPLGMRVVTAENGMYIDNLITRYNPALILLDIMMPGNNGYECCRAIRSRYSIAELPVIFLSAKNRISDLLLGFEAGGNDYVLKPFLREELVARVTAQIRQKEAAEAIRENEMLKADLADRLIEEANLKQMQEWLTRLLHSIDDALLVINEESQIVYVNNILSTILGIPSDDLMASRDASCLLHTDAIQRNLITAKLSRSRYTSVLFRNANSDPVELLVKRTPLTIQDQDLLLFTMRTPVVQKNKNRHVSDWIIEELERNQARINELEVISAECIRSNKRLMEQLTLPEQYEEDPFNLGHRIMVETINLWKQVTGKEKWDFAESSGLWKVHPDEDGWQRTVTLDKYLDFRKMPRFPRWSIILESARFVVTEAQKRESRSERIAEINKKVKMLEEILLKKDVV